MAKLLPYKQVLAVRFRYAPPFFILKLNSNAGVAQFGRAPDL